MLLEESMHLCFVGSALDQVLKKLHVMFHSLVVSLHRNPACILSAICGRVVVFTLDGGVLPSQCWRNLCPPIPKANHDPNVAIVRQHPVLVFLNDALDLPYR